MAGTGMWAPGSIDPGGAGSAFGFIEQSDLRIALFVCAPGNWPAVAGREDWSCCTGVSGSGGECPHIRSDLPLRAAGKAQGRGI